MKFKNAKVQGLFVAALGGALGYVVAKAKVTSLLGADDNKPVASANGTQTTGEGQNVQEKTPIAQGKKPNLVFMLSENLGYDDLSLYGGDESRGCPTPRTDQLAREGLPLASLAAAE
jgi:hypothetical protein